jgi:TatD DNase family protein
MPEFDPDREEVVGGARAGGVTHILCPIDLTSQESLSRVLDLKRKFPGIAAAAGVHPHQAKDYAPSQLDEVRQLAASGRISALGEIGLDHHYDFSPAAAQAEVFRVQLRLAQELGLPVIVHSREAGRETLAAIREEGFERGGVLHCFTEDRETALRMIDRGFRVSFSGILTYPGAGGLREIAAALPLDRILVETDSPYLVPQALRGARKRNEPLFVVETAKVLAGLKKISLAEVADHTLMNYRAAFRV